MKTVNISVALEKSSPTKIQIGRQGENRATKVVFDCSVYTESFGAGTAYLFHQRAPDTCPYPVAIEQDGNTITWEVSASDTEFAGQGQCELRWHVDEVIAKTQVWSTTVTEALAGTESEEVPEAAQGWVNQVLEAISEVGKVNEDVIKAAVAAYIADNGLPDTDGVGFTSWSYDTDTGYIHLLDDDGKDVIEPLYAPGLGFADLTEDELQQVNTILTRASNYAAQAGQAKEAASASAENATKSAQNAATSAERATQSASAAATSETNASQSASSAAADADLAKQYNDSALKAAGEAAQSLSGAQDAAETAQEAAQEAIAARDGFKVDTTLSQSGQAADAKAVGDALSSLSEENAELKGDLIDLDNAAFTVEKGSTNVFDYTNITKGKILKQDIGISTSETYQDSTNGFVANQIWNVKKGDVIHTTSAYCGLCIYDERGILQEKFNNENKDHSITIDSACFLRLYCSASSATYTSDFMLSINTPLPNNYEEYKADKKVSNFTKLEEKINETAQEIKKINETVNGVKLSENLLDNASVLMDKRPSNWAEQTVDDSYTSSGYHTFKAIPVTQEKVYYFVENGELINFGQLATYDCDRKYVSLISPSKFNINGVNVGYVIPEGISYVRGESNTSDFSNVNFKLFNGRFEKEFLQYNEEKYEDKILPVIVFDFDQIVEIDARFTILKKYGFVGNVVESSANNYELTKKLIKMGYDISPYLGNHTWDYSTEDGVQKLTANIAEKIGNLESIGVYNPTMISCSGNKYSDTMETILANYQIDYIRCTGFIKNGTALKKSVYENSYDTKIVVPIGLGSYNSADEFITELDTLVNGNVPLIMPFMHTFGYDADWITEETFENIVSHVSDLVKTGKALCMNMHDFVVYNDPVKSSHDDYIRMMSALF